MIRNISYFPAVLLLASTTFAQPPINQFIDDTVVQQISLTVNPTDWEAFLQNYEDDTYYHATFVWNGISEDVGIRQHGKGSRSPIKPDIDLNFAHYTSSQTFLGEGFLVLIANNEDPSNLHEWLSMKLFRKMGFPAPRVSFGTVTVNGTLLGFYEIVEHDDLTFVERNFGEDGGYFYEWANIGDDYDFGNLGTNPNLYSPYLDLKSNQASPDLQTFTNLVQVINQPASSSFTDAQFIAALEQYMDPQMFLTYVATDNVLAEADGIVGGIIGMNNFDLYQFQGTTVYTLTPWDTGLSFDAVNFDIFTGFKNGNINVLANRLIAIAGYLNIYLDQLNRAASLLGGAGGWADSEISREYGVINTAASNDPNKQCPVNGVLVGCGVADFQNGVAWDHSFLQQRAAFVLSEIAANGYQPPTDDPVVSLVSSNGLSSAPGMSPGALVLINGSQLGAVPAAASQYPLPRSLANNFVSVEGERAVLAFTTSGQIEMQVPWDIPIGDASVVVSVNGAMSNSFDSTMQTAEPAILAITHGNGTSITAGSPATAGEEIVIYLTGLGAVDTEPLLGAAAPAVPLANATVPSQVSIGNTGLTVLFAGLTPGTAGVYQVNAVLPQMLAQTGSAGLTVSAGGQTASIQLPVQ
jgi:uncharacterized protein (TIGR03437 family)